MQPTYERPERRPRTWGAAYPGHCVTRTVFFKCSQETGILPFFLFFHVLFENVRDGFRVARFAFVDECGPSQFQLLAGFDDDAAFLTLGERGFARMDSRA